MNNIFENYRNYQIKEIYGEQYKKFIHFAIEKSDYFILVQRNDMPCGDTIDELLEKLEPYLINVRKQKSWANTQLRGSSAYVFYYHSHKECESILVEYANNMFDWQQPRLLEDLSFYKEENILWVSNTAHEEELYMEKVSNEEKSELIMMGIRLKHI
ncbi:hypothetical protein SAMN05444673_4064 [Bacillus sp. OV166]|uniref:stage III sporulation protein AH n=1 Tax=Bacillus sp. OV166 TaxID=1882763 RepID=UPI000A2ADF3A|nr:stage III sporulation protein AH [Bacillus sp. OV166]SMQ80968.1 hypothetical protein SAMN05444673_4064 [Bacillus sp. OV166]